MKKTIEVEICDLCKEKEEELHGYKRIHILISINPDNYNEINKELEIIKEKIIGRGEYEQSAN